jgi:hypothetical protein
MKFKNGDAVIYSFSGRKIKAFVNNLCECGCGECDLMIFDKNDHYSKIRAGINSNILLSWKEINKSHPLTSIFKDDKLEKSKKLEIKKVSRQKEFDLDRIRLFGIWEELT